MMQITNAPAVGVVSPFWFESYDSNAGLCAFVGIVPIPQRA